MTDQVGNGAHSNHTGNITKMRWQARIAAGAAIWAVVLVASLVGIYSRMPGTLATFWLSNALLLGLLLRNPQIAGALTWLAAGTGYLTADILTGGEWLSAALLNSANLMGVLAGFYAFRRFRPVELTLRQARSVAWLSALAVVASATAALLGGIVEVVMFDGDWAGGALSWFAIELFNYAVILPLVLAFPVDCISSAVSHRSLSGVRRSLDIQWRRLAVPGVLLLIVLLPSWYLGGLGALVFTTPALIAAALLTDVFTTAVFVAASTTWALVLIVTERASVIDAAGIPLAPSTMIGLALLAVGPLAIASTISEREQVSEALRLAMTQDDLTRAFRRQEFVRRADSALATAARDGQPTSLLMMDLDRFKKLNDNCGHQAGDRALVAFADVVRRLANAHDVFARLGGEEFALLVIGQDLAASRALAEEIRRHQKNTADEFGEWGSTVSIGLACAATSDVTLDELMADADGALYCAKTRRNHVVAAQHPRTCRTITNTSA
ncbi:hypothetical protein HLY00_4571 [Mycolicibacterium hippocampi]|uniref:GGDEF domain-containing protein n=2 Tax=Mycobacteriaceae TaxID=1762 RepID=A0A850PE27_9MYCO|nr:hypothetical protein [Mycolicibacterium hippocampi]